MEKKLRNNRKFARAKNPPPKASGARAGKEKIMYPANEESLSDPMALIPANSFLEAFKYRQFARNYIKFDQNLVLSYKATFGDTGEQIKKIIQKAAGILSKAQVQIELQRILPSEHDLVDVVKKALAAPTPALISWSEKHKFWESAAEMKGLIRKKDDTGGVTNNVVMFVKE